MLTAAQVKAIAGPGAKPALVAAVVQGWSAAVSKAKLTTKNRACHFLAQIMTETGGLQILSESGAYKADRILHIFGQRHSAKIGPEEARRIAALPVAQRGPVLFNRVYGVGNPKKMREFNNTGPNDGWLYRGGGMMQCTGKNNYAAMAKKTGMPLVEHPELLHNPDSAFKAAYLEWICNAAADRDDVVAVRKIINGGTNGLAECKAFLAKAKKALAGYSVDEDEAPDSSSNRAETDLKLEPAPMPEAPVGPDGELILATKKKLDELGYHEFGTLDSEWGGRTVAAIAAYKLDRGMSGPAEIDDALTAQLNRDIADKWRRPIKDERAKATVNDLAPHNEAIKQNWWTRLWAKIVAIPAGVGAAVSGVMDKFPDAKANYIDPVMDFFVDVPGWLWFVVAAGAAAAIWIGTRKSDSAVVKDFQDGKLMR
ncbi:glycoside hydrolase family 19 protein [Bradyrhizobium liaoningense]|uniref:glycoside hydrolase family 19 protein n=1 Tax=Bradyrhizobium liaoningense TaxID=43992 RepID=UPI0004B8F1BF|nr:hypothetical protein [Bradyrhizobium liaoningense]